MDMSDIREILLSTIEEKRPLVLLLSEDAWSESARGDTVLASVLRKLRLDSDVQRGWAGMLSGKSLPADHYSWLAERFERRVHPAFIEILHELPWCAVFTSSVDPTLVRLFSHRGREAQPILTAAEHPRQARSTMRPPLYYLFSRAGEQDFRAQPPGDQIGLITRRTRHAVQLLDRIRETATPIGTIVVDGFAHGQGWLRFEDLLGTLANASSNQVLWFGGRPALPPSEDAHFATMEQEGRILVENRRLGTIIAELRAIGRLADAIPLESEDAGRVSFGTRGTYEVSPEVRLRVEAVAAIVDDSWTSFLPPLGQDANYDAFRRFHGDIGGPRLLVEGIRRGYAIRRDFEDRLYGEVSAAIADHSKLEAPIVVEGQSGTGKSVALARLVSTVREEKTAAVLYAIGRIPQSQEVSAFCEEAERSHARVTLVVCDANDTIDSYDELLSGLRSRGRRVVVLGSQYRANANEGTELHSRIQAPVALSEHEKRDIRDLLNTFDITGRTQVEGDHFLAILYRHLPASRPQLRSGLGAEARAAVHLLEERGTKPQPVPIISHLHQQLIDKGFISQYQPVFDDQVTNALDDDDRSAAKIIDMVMVAGRLHCPVPINLLLRAVADQFQRFDSNLISDLFGDLDLIRWKARDLEGTDLLVLPRLPLEAQLICERRLGSSEAEATVLLDLIGSIRIGIDTANEREFLLKLLQQIGHEGPRGNIYRHSYMAFARKLTELRDNFNVVDASLMLQESAFRRSAVREQEVGDDERFQLLEEARDAVQTALDGLGSGQITASRRTRQNLLVERAALYGFLAYDRARRHQTPAEVWAAYETARVAVRQAVSAADNYYPYDVGLWTPADLFDSADLTDSQRAELAADIYSILDQVEQESLPPSQKRRFDRRRMAVGSALNDHELTEDAYRKLEKSGSTAGYFLRARRLSPDLNKEDVVVTAPSDLRKAETAANFLAERIDKIQQDERCLWLLLENRWISEMHRRPLRGLRQPLPVDEGRRRFLSIVRALNQAAGQSARYGTRYLEAVLTWLTGDYIAARELFQQLYHETDNVYRGRIFLRHVVSNANGLPRSFGGRVEDKRGEGRWRLRVSELSQTVDLLERDFPHEDVQYGRTLSTFTIGFNFIGPIAVPIRR